MNQNNTNADKVRENIDLHERIASRYDDRHGEIYNDVEQERLHHELEHAVRLVTSSSGQPRVFDLGCGSGNLTRHLLALGCHVTTADVTPTFVKMASALDPANTTPYVLNGVDLSEIPDASFDLAATYSVLHHIPDYILIVQEMARIVKPGGIVYLDHERCERYYQNDAVLQRFFTLTKEHLTVRWYISQLLRPAWWVKRWKKTLNPRYQEEGDIHVWPDDHIEWPRIRETLQHAGMKIERDHSYLHFQSRYDRGVYEQYRSQCEDMRVLIARKG
ncbi:MAG: class I SAM-dependent methyltransferase [Ignavibacteriae bacterium]|nr:MAG: class I SAM-dependent methyltransferase [Ignavibacteriota bacterium]